MNLELLSMMLVTVCAAVGFDEIGRPTRSSATPA